jgi:hypothetical protein
LQQSIASHARLPKDPVLNARAAQVLRAVEVLQQLHGIASADLPRHRHGHGRTGAAHGLGHALDRRGAKATHTVGELDAGEEDAEHCAFDAQVFCSRRTRGGDHLGVQFGQQCFALRGNLNRTRHVNIWPAPERLARPTGAPAWRAQDDTTRGRKSVMRSAVFAQGGSWTGRIILILLSFLAPDGHFKFPHLWPLKLPQAGRSDYGFSDPV